MITAISAKRGERGEHIGLIITPVMLVVTVLFVILQQFALLLTPILGTLVALSLFIPI